MGYATVDEQVAAACETAALRLSEAGAKVDRVELDWNDPYDCWSVFFYGGATARLGDELAERRDLLDPGFATDPFDSHSTLTGLQRSGQCEHVT